MFANPGIANRAYHIIPAQGCVMELITHGTHGSVECHKPSEFRAAGGAMSVKQYRRSPCNFHNPEPSPTELAIELVRVKAELRRRLEICDEFGQACLVFTQFISETPTKVDVLPQIFSEISHRAPPGHG